MGKVSTWLLLVMAILIPVTQTGCFIVPYSMGFATPIPVPAWSTERMEEKYCYSRDHRATILPPIREGYPPPPCLDPPDVSLVIRSMPKCRRGVAYVIEEFR